MPEKLTTEQFAARMKQRAPELQSVPDADLVRKVLERRPEMKDYLVTEVPRQPLSRRDPFLDRMEKRLGEVKDSMRNLPEAAGARSAQLFKEAREKKSIPGMVRAPLLAIDETLLNMGKGIFGVTTPGMLARAAKGEDPANIVTDASLMMIPAGKPAEVIAKATDALKSEMTPSIVGAHTRATEGFSKVEKVAGDVPVDPGPVMDWVGKIQELGKKGYTVPKVISDLARWVDEKSKPSLQKASDGGMIDTAGTSFPLTVKDAREFYSAMNEAIPWNEEGYGGKGGRMFYAVDKARQALHDSTLESVKPYGLDLTLKQAMADYARVARWRERSYGVGWLSGKLAGYSAGAFTGHPLMTGYVGGKAGESLAGSMVKSITESK